MNAPPAHRPLLCCVLVAFSLGCTKDGPAPPPAPAGLYLRGPAAALGAALQRMATHPPGTRATRWALLADKAARRLEGCAGTYVAHAVDGSLDTLLDSVRCAPNTETKGTGHDRHALWLPAGPDGARAHGQLRPGPAGLRVELSLPADGGPGWADIFRVRAATTALPWTVPADALAQAQGHAREIPVPGPVLDALGLKLNALEAAALSAMMTGRWAMLLLPSSAQPPQLRFAVAVEMRDADILRRGMQTEVEKIRQTFRFTVDERQTAEGVALRCAKGLALVPGFAPCLAQTGRWLVVGWNADSVPALVPQTAAPAQVELSLTRMAALDPLFENQAAAPPVAYPFDAIRATLGPDTIQLHMSYPAVTP